MSSLKTQVGVGGDILPWEDSKVQILPFERTRVALVWTTAKVMNNAVLYEFGLRSHLRRTEVPPARLIFPAGAGGQRYWRHEISTSAPASRCGRRIPGHARASLVDAFRPVA